VSYKFIAWSSNIVCCRFYASANTMKLPTAVLASWTRRSLHTRVVQRIVREPEYLDSAGPKTPVYGPLNIRLTSYDFPVLENFSGYVHKTAENLGFTVEECWPAPATKMEVNLLKQPNQTQVKLSKTQKTLLTFIWVC